MKLQISLQAAARTAVCFVIFASTAVGADDPFAQRLDAVLASGGGFGAVAYARVVTLPERQELYACNADRPCKPASTYKLLTTATALDLFGPQHTFKTYLAKDGDDLWIIGTGDPGTGDEWLLARHGQKPLTMLEDWAKALKERGITRIPGDLVYYDGAFESLTIHPTWKKKWLLDWYGAPVSGLNFNGNCVDITILPTEPGKRVAYEVCPPVQGIQIVNECATVKAKGRPDVIKRAGSNTYMLTGTCDHKMTLESKPVENPGLFFADALRMQLAKAGIEVAGTIRRADKPLGEDMTPPADKVVAVHSTALTDILWRTNKNSQNLFAECLCKAVGQAFDARQDRHLPGSWKSGGEAIRDFLRRNGISEAGLVPADGTGLSSDGRVTARIMTDLLAVMAARPDFDVYRESLPIAGTDGTLRIRMTDIKGRVFAKTGSVEGVSGMCGYVKTLEGKLLAFCFIVTQGGPPSRTPDEACKLLVRWQSGQAATSPAQ